MIKKFNEYKINESMNYVDSYNQILKELSDIIGDGFTLNEPNVPYDQLVSKLVDLWEKCGSILDSLDDDMNSDEWTLEEDQTYGSMYPKLEEISTSIHDFLDSRQHIDNLKTKIRENKEQNE